MRDDFPGDDPKNIWLNQPTEQSTMTLELLRQKARKLHARTRRQLLGTLAVPLSIGFFYAFAMKQFPQQPVLQPLFAFALTWSLAGLYFLNRGKWSGAIPEDMGFSAGIEICRREIARRRDYCRRVLLWSLGPVILAIGTFILALAIVAGRGIFPNAMPFITLVAVWIAAYFFIIRVRERRELQHEIDELDDIERQNSR